MLPFYFFGRSVFPNVHQSVTTVVQNRRHIRLPQQRYSLQAHYLCLLAASVVWPMGHKLLAFSKRASNGPNNIPKYIRIFFLGEHDEDKIFKTGGWVYFSPCSENTLSVNESFNRNISHFQVVYLLGIWCVKVFKLQVCLVWLSFIFIFLFI